ncbi:MAG: hypothetical protein JNN17_15860 [Verrucomicrobiaceae bacterium]|nr:hypothetical protein [Verrucomicrobiaceae bacterium]
MAETLTKIGISLAIWWIAMTLLCLRDYFARKEESKKRGPLTEQERAEMEKMLAGLPRKDLKPAWWYFLHPIESAKLGVTGLLTLPFIIILLPMILLLYVLPDPNRK